VFGQKAWALAKRRGWEWAKDHQVIGDGAPWIWNLTQDLSDDNYNCPLMTIRNAH
jgi:hypothetical protein